MSEKTSGHCLCGHTTYSFEGRRTWSCYCHCEDCTRNCAAPVVAFIGVQLEGFAWQLQDGRDEPKFYASSQGVKRFFCDNCGTPMAFQAEHYEGEIHLYAPTLDNPADFEPHFHVHYGKKFSWLHLEDALPHHHQSAPTEEEARARPRALK